VNYVRVDSAFTPHEQAEIEAAEHAWTEATGDCFEPVNLVSRQDLKIDVGHRQDFIVLFLSEPNKAASAIGAYDAGTRTITILPEEDPMEGDYLEDTVAHELGHYLNLNHWPAGLMVNMDARLDHGKIPWATVQQYWSR
jgi:hypothetical protein